MPKTKLLTRVAGFLDVLGAAAKSAAAVEAHQSPRTRDLRTLGIDPAAFRNIGH